MTELTPANRLTKRLTQYKDHDDVLVLGIPRGGVPVAFEVAQALQVPLDILLVRKLGAPEQKELAIGAIASGGIRILNRELIAALGVTEEELAATIAVQEDELERREQLYRGVRPGISVQGRITILVDDGIATGPSMLAAISALRSLQPKRIVVATPVAPSHARDQIGQAADEFVCVLEPAYFFGHRSVLRRFWANRGFEVSSPSQKKRLECSGSGSAPRCLMWSWLRPTGFMFPPHRRPADC